MNIITGINNIKIYNQLKETNGINIKYKDIQYKEAILEILEKNKNIQYIIIREDIKGQINLIELINKIKEINKKIKIIIILIKKDKEKNKENYYNKNHINFLYLEEANYNNILKLLSIKNKNKIIGILGNSGTGKTITTLILSELLISKNKNILIITDKRKSKLIIETYLKERSNGEKINNKKNNNNEEKQLINIKNNLDILYNENIEQLLEIIDEKNKINYDYIFVIINNFLNYKKYKKITQKNILIINSNILELNKIKKLIINLLNEKKEINFLLNNYNENSISEKIIKNIYNNKLKFLEKLNYNKNYNLIINNNIDIKFLDNKTKNKFENIIERI